MVASIAGTVFKDLDFDGVQDLQEAGLDYLCLSEIMIICC